MRLAGWYIYVGWGGGRFQISEVKHHRRLCYHPLPPPAFVLQILLMITAVCPLLDIAFDFSVKWVQRCFLINCWENGSQANYDAAFRPPSFDLASHVSDIMLNMTVALVFGSGMPLCYIIVLIMLQLQYWLDRVAITRLCIMATRYSKQLPKLIIRKCPGGQQGGGGAEDGGSYRGWVGGDRYRGWRRKGGS